MNKQWKNDGINNEKMLRFNEKITEFFGSLLPEIPVNLQQVHAFFRGFFTCFLGIFSHIFSLIFAYIFCWFFHAFSFFFFTHFSFFFSQGFLLKIKFKFNYLFTNYLPSLLTVLDWHQTSSYSPPTTGEQKGGLAQYHRGVCGKQQTEHERTCEKGLSLERAMWVVCKRTLQGEAEWRDSWELSESRERSSIVSNRDETGALTGMPKGLGRHGL